MAIVFGLGSGRCGTKSLQSLINSQDNAVCFHEINPTSMSWKDSELTVMSLLRDFNNSIYKNERLLTIDRMTHNRKSPIEKYLNTATITTIGDVASYYLPYVEKILSNSEDVVFPCLIRDREEVVRSFINKLHVKESSFKSMYHKIVNKKEPYRNHWASNNANYYKDDIWDQLHPTIYNAKSIDESIRKYYDMYYQEARRLQDKYKEVKIFSVSDLNSISGKEDILDFCRVDSPNLNIHAHENAKAYI